MRLLQVNDNDSRGGAAAVARQLHEGYARAGHEAWLAVGEKRSDARNVVEIPNDARRSAWERSFLRLAKGRSSRAARLLFGAVSSPRRALRASRGEENFEHPGTRELLSIAPRPDAVHFHNLHGEYFDLRELPAITGAVPALITLHDAWLLSGHCAHSLDCERWTHGCGECPYLDVYPAVMRDATAANWRRKQEILRRSRLFVVTPSQWLMERAQRSILQPAMSGARVIPLGVDLDVFRPSSREAARAALNLPQDAVVLLAAGNELETNPFKDYAALREAVSRIREARPDRNVVFVAAGGATKFETPAAMANAYAAADVFLHVARADTFPLVVLEALACGTPVVATPVGGIPEQIVDGETGFLTPSVAVGALRILDDPSLRERMSRAARADAERRFDAQRMIDEYLNAIAEVAG